MIYATFFNVKLKSKISPEHRLTLDLHELLTNAANGVNTMLYIAEELNARVKPGVIVGQNDQKNIDSLLLCSFEPLIDNLIGLFAVLVTICLNRRCWIGHRAVLISTLAAHIDAIRSQVLAEFLDSLGQSLTEHRLGAIEIYGQRLPVVELSWPVELVMTASAL